MLDQTHMDSRTADWLERRGIPRDIAEPMGVVTIGGHPAFEFKKDGVLQYRKVRVSKADGSKTFRRDRGGSETCLWNIDGLAEELSSETTPLIITEGEIDALSWVVAGATHVVSVPDGAQKKEVGTDDIDPLADTGFSWLWGKDGKLLPELRKFKRIILSVDDDPAGHVLREELAIRLGPKRCWFVKSYGEDCKDANAALLKFGEDFLMDILVDGIAPVSPSRLVSIMDIPTVKDRVAYDLGWKSIRSCIKIVPPELCIVTGEPGAGKSQFALGMACQLARKYRLKTCILQFEDSVSRLQNDIQRYADAWRGDRGLTSTGEPIPGTSKDFERRYFMSVMPPQGDEDEPDFDLDWIKEQVEAAVLQHDCKLVIIDPWNEIEHCWGVSENETQYTNKALKQIKSWARRFNICIIVVAHPSKSISTKDVEDCSLYDVSGSAAWNNKADHGVILKRVTDADGEQTNFVDVKVSKCKDWRIMGRPGIGRLLWDEEHSLYKAPEGTKVEAKKDAKQLGSDN